MRRLALIPLALGAGEFGSEIQAPAVANGEGYRLSS
jgi:hypothetical protein